MFSINTTKNPLTHAVYASLLASGLLLSACSQPNTQTADTAEVPAEVTEQGTVLDTSDAQALSDDSATQAHADVIEPHTEGHGHGHDHAHDDMIQYNCQPQATIRADYHTDNDGESLAHLLIDDVMYDLYQVPAASGELYATEVGIQEGQGMSWHVTGDNAILESMPLDHTAAPEDTQTIYTCSKYAS